MLIDPVGFFDRLPQLAAVPVMLMIFSFVMRSIVHREPLVASFHGLPPRLALTAIGVTAAAILSPQSYLAVHTGVKLPWFALVIVLLFLTLYVLCEFFHFAAKRGGRNQIWTLLGGGFAFGIAVLAFECARTTP